MAFIPRWYRGDATMKAFRDDGRTEYSVRGDEEEPDVGWPRGQSTRHGELARRERKRKPQFRTSMAMSVNPALARRIANVPGSIATMVSKA